MYENYEQWLCHKYDVNYMIMQSNMTMMKRVIINGTMESCMAIYLGMAMEYAIIGRYGGFFEEDIWWVYDTDERCAVLERLAMVEG